MRRTPDTLRSPIVSARQTAKVADRQGSTKLQKPFLKSSVSQ
jgi:hypothetical protein